MIKELEELKIKRKIAAKVCGLIDRGRKYNKSTPDDKDLEERFMCTVENWMPDKDWNQFMYFVRNADMDQFRLRFIMPPAFASSEDPSSDFTYIMSNLK